MCTESPEKLNATIRVSYDDSPKSQYTSVGRMSAHLIGLIELFTKTSGCPQLFKVEQYFV